MEDVPLHFRVIHGYRRAFRMGGEGPPLLLIHGIGDSSSTWSAVLPELAQRHTVIAPDLLGHGASAKPRADYAAAAYANGMRDLLSILDVDRVTVIGHSLGAGVAMQFAYQFPERCERLVIVGSGGVNRTVHPLLRVAALPGTELLMPLALSAPVRLLTRMAAPALRRVMKIGDDLSYMQAKMAGLDDRESRQAFLRTLRGVVDPRGQVVTMLDRCYLTAGMPVLIVWGANDRIVPVSHAYAAHQAMPGSRLSVFESSGHFPHLDAPERFLALVEEFIDTTDPSSYDAATWRALLRAGRPAPADVATLSVDLANVADNEAEMAAIQEALARFSV